MTPIRYSANGGFNDTHLYVKYPDFAAPVPALASATASTEQTNVRDRKTASAQRTLTGRMGVQDASGVVRESAHESYSQHQSQDWAVDSRGERSKLSGGRWG